MRYNNVKFIEPLAAAADALTARQAQEMQGRGSGIRRSLRRMDGHRRRSPRHDSPFADHHGGQAWALSDESRISFTSTKNGLVSETHSLAAIKGGVSGEGTVELQFDLRAIETNIPIRNERMQSGSSAMSQSRSSAPMSRLL